MQEQLHEYVLMDNGKNQYPIVLKLQKLLIVQQLLLQQLHLLGQRLNKVKQPHKNVLQVIQEQLQEYVMQMVHGILNNVNALKKQCLTS